MLLLLPFQNPNEAINGVFGRAVTMATATPRLSCAPERSMEFDGAVGKASSRA